MTEKIYQPRKEDRRKSSRREADDKVMVTFELDREVYFEVLKLCIEKKQTFEEFVVKAVKEQLEIIKNCDAG